MIFVDSDHLSVLVDRRDARHRLFEERLAATTDQVAIPVVVAEEHLRGWLAQIHRVRDPAGLVDPYDRLIQLISFFAECVGPIMQPGSSDACELLASGSERKI